MNYIAGAIIMNLDHGNYESPVCKFNWLIINLIKKIHLEDTKKKNQ